MVKYLIGILIFIIVVPLVLKLIDIIRGNSNGNKDDELTPADFERYKKSIHQNCSKEEFEAFFAFLRHYKGGYYRRRKGEVIYRDYTGREKGDLKGIFYNIVFSNPNLSTEDKEEFRMFIISKGVTGCNARPDYETRDSRLSNRKETEDEYEKKEVGNKGEAEVRRLLNRLEYKGFLVINGPVLEYNGRRVEFDHIVIGNNGVFALETKAFGASVNGNSKASLFIDKGDKWILRKNGNNRELKSPTEQILLERDHLKGILHSAKEKIDVKPILVLSNNDLFLKNNIRLEYEVVLLKNLEELIDNSMVNRIFEEEKHFIAQIIDEHRKNA